MTAIKPKTFVEADQLAELVLTALGTAPGPMTAEQIIRELIADYRTDATAIRAAIGRLIEDKSIERCRKFCGRTWRPVDGYRLSVQ